MYFLISLLFLLLFGFEFSIVLFLFSFLQWESRYLFQKYILFEYSLFAPSGLGSERSIKRLKQFLRGVYKVVYKVVYEVKFIQYLREEIWIQVPRSDQFLEGKLRERLWRHGKYSQILKTIYLLSISFFIFLFASLILREYFFIVGVYSIWLRWDLPNHFHRLFAFRRKKSSFLQRRIFFYQPGTENIVRVQFLSPGDYDLRFPVLGRSFFTHYGQLTTALNTSILAAIFVLWFSNFLLLTFLEYSSYCIYPVVIYEKPTLDLYIYKALPIIEYLKDCVLFFVGECYRILPGYFGLTIEIEFDALQSLYAQLRWSDVYGSATGIVWFLDFSFWIGEAAVPLILLFHYYFCRFFFMLLVCGSHVGMGWFDRVQAPMSWPGLRRGWLKTGRRFMRGREPWRKALRKPLRYPWLFSFLAGIFDKKISLARHKTYDEFLIEKTLEKATRFIERKRYYVRFWENFYYNFWFDYYSNFLLVAYLNFHKAYREKVILDYNTEYRWMLQGLTSEGMNEPDYLSLFVVTLNWDLLPVLVRIDDYLHPVKHWQPITIEQSKDLFAYRFCRKDCLSTLNFFFVTKKEYRKYVKKLIIFTTLVKTIKIVHRTQDAEIIKEMDAEQCYEDQFLSSGWLRFFSKK